jgi:hypothetical protein
MPNLMFLAHNEISAGQRVQSFGLRGFWPGFRWIAMAVDAHSP